MRHETLEGMLRAGRSQEVLSEAERLIDLPDLTPKEALWVSVWACRAAGGLQEWGRAITWADRGLEVGTHDAEAEGILRFSAARALLYIGDLIRAGRELERFLHLSMSTPQLAPAIADAHFNLGHLRRLLGQSDAAVTAFLRARNEYAAQGRDYRRVLSQYEIAWTYLQAGEPAFAEPHLSAVRQEVSEIRDDELQVDLALAEGLYHTLQGEYTQTLSICSGLAHERLLPPRQRAELHWLLGQCALLQEDLDGAARHLLASQNAAAADWWPPQMERIARLRENLMARQASGR